MDTTFKNEKRNRYYGLRIGDIVDPKGLSGKTMYPNAEVVGFAYSDNNRVYIRKENGKITDWVAEWCDIITKVEDRNIQCDCFWCDVPIYENQKKELLPDQRGYAHGHCAEEWYGVQMAEG